MKRTHRLFDLEIAEISFCDRGANPGAELLFTKRRDVSKLTAEEIPAMLDELIEIKIRELWERWKRKAIERGEDPETVPKPSRAAGLAAALETRAAQIILEFWGQLKGVSKHVKQDEIFEIGKRFASLKVTDPGLTEQQRFIQFWQSNDPDAVRLRDLHKAAAPKEVKVKPIVTDAYRELQRLGREMVEAGEVSTIEQGIAKAARARPALWLSHLQERTC